MIAGRRWMVSLHRIKQLMIAIVVFVTSSMNVAMMMRTKCSSVFVVMMRAASEQNVRTESDERCAMDETSKHGTVSLQL
jgi:hypothetical protein